MKASFSFCFQEVTTDVVDPKLPTLEDLGVRLALMEDEVPGFLQTVRRAMYYYESVGEFPVPKPAPHLWFRNNYCQTDVDRHR